MRFEAVRKDVYLLLHDLEVDLLHVNLLTKLHREFSRLEQLCIHAARHFCFDLELRRVEVKRSLDQNVVGTSVTQAARISTPSPMPARFISTASPHLSLPLSTQSSPYLQSYVNNVVNSQVRSFTAIWSTKLSMSY